jgi:hypothetical protein
MSAWAHSQAADAERNGLPARREAEIKPLQVLVLETRTAPTNSASSPGALSAIAAQGSHRVPAEGLEQNTKRLDVCMRQTVLVMFRFGFLLSTRSGSSIYRCYAP